MISLGTTDTHYCLSREDAILPLVMRMVLAFGVFQTGVFQEGGSGYFQIVEDGLGAKNFAFEIGQTVNDVFFPK